MNILLVNIINSSISKHFARNLTSPLKLLTRVYFISGTNIMLTKVGIKRAKGQAFSPLYLHTTETHRKLLE